MTSKYIPDRGDVVWVDFNPTKGHEQDGRRPAFVVSPKIYNEKSGLMLICPVTSKIKNYPFEVVLGGKHITGVVLTDQLRTFDWLARRAEKIEKVKYIVVEEVKSKILTLIS